MAEMGIPKSWALGAEPHMDAQRFSAQYFHKLISVRPGSLYAYWPIWEPSGTDVQDYSGNGDRATSTGLGVRTAGPDGVHQAPAFAATPSHVNVLSAEFTSRFNGLEGTIMGWGQVAAVGQWADAQNRTVCYIDTVTGDSFRFGKSDVNNSLQFVTQLGGIYRSTVIAITNPGVAWFHIGITFSRAADQLKYFFQGNQIGVTVVTGGAFAGALGTALLGAQSTVATRPWLGYLAHVALWNVALSASEIKHISEV